ncbi:MAG: GAF domain-containing SpoIIE family protein phosphatase, partial [Candidatus Hydrothermarchaeales archaeon]
PAIAVLMTFSGRTFFGIPILTNFLAIPILIFPAAIAYAIAKHNLFDVDVFIKRTVGYIIMTIIVGAAYFGIQTTLSTFVLRPVLGDSAEKVYPLIFALLVVFLFNPLNRRVQELVDKLFYRKKFDYKGAVTSISDKLRSMLSQNAIIMHLINTVRKDMFVDTASVVLLDSTNKLCKTTFLDDVSDKSENQTKDITVAYDDPLLTLLTSKKKMITKYEIAEDPRYADVKEACGKSFLELDASLVIPLIYKDEVKGVFTLGHKKSGHFYSRDDIDLLETLANQGTVAIENARLFEENLEKGRMEEELKIGHDIQMSMLPEKAPEIEGFKIAARSIPAREVGGDFYDFIEIRSSEADDRLAIVIGDVSGKGVSAGLVMAASRSTYRALSAQDPSVEKVISLGNQRLNNDIKKGMFVALIYAVLSPGERTLTLSNAGQTQPIICTDGESKPSYIVTDGDTFPQGIVKDCQYLEKQVKLKEGSTVVFYTDGVVEAMNEKEEMYGFERLMAAIDEGRGLDANSLLEKLMGDVTLFVGGAKQHDDLTLIVVKVE